MISKVLLMKVIIPVLSCYSDYIYIFGARKHSRYPIAFTQLAHPGQNRFKTVFLVMGSSPRAEFGHFAVVRPFSD